MQIKNGPNYSVDLRHLTNVKVGTRLSFCRFNSSGTNIKIHSIEISNKQLATLQLNGFGSLVEVVYNASNVWNVVGGQGYNIL